MDRVSTTSEHEGDSGVESTHSSGESFVYIRVSVPELNLQKCLRFNPEETVWVAKQQILSTLAKDLKDESNFGIFCPAVNGRAGKFMDEERLLKDYSLPGPIGFLEFKYKRRVYKQTNVNPRKLKQLHSKSNLKQFMDAVRKMDADKIRKLTDKGMDPNFQDLDSGETPLSLATTLLQSRDVLMALVEGGAIFDFRTRGGLTPVHTAAKMGNVDALGLLLDLGSGVNYRDDRGLTPLYHAVCHSQSSPCVHLLLFNYATVGITDSAGWTELHQACKAGRVQHVEQLIFYGIDTNQQNSGGNTALHVAAVNNQEECVRVLLFRGADHTIQNYANQTAAEVAIIANNKQVAKLIREFSPSNVVPIHAVPSYNSKRRGRACATTPSSSHIQRSRSNPPLHTRGSTLTVAVPLHDTMSGPLKPTKATSGGGGHLEESNEQTSGRVYSGIRSERHGSEPRGGYDSDSLRSLSISSTSSVSGETDGVVTLRKQIGEGDVIHRTRTVILPKSSNGYGFVLRGAKFEAAKSNGSNVATTSMLDFTPSAQCPGLQYVEHVDAGGAADKAGLLPGDFIMEINGISVERASHEYAVQLIMQTSDELRLIVTTLAVPPHRSGGVGGNSRLSTTTTGGAKTNGHTIPQDFAFGTIRHYGHSRPISMELKSFNDETVQSGAVLSLPESANALPQDCGYWSVPRRGPKIPVRNSSSSNTLKPKQRADLQDSVYAVPVKEKRHETSRRRSTPPLVPPQDYQTSEFAGSDFVPITTKLPHTYANVSQSSCLPAPAAATAAATAAAAADVESSFRPGTNARLSLSEAENSNDVKRRDSQQKLLVANHNDSSEPAVSLPENGTRRRRTPGERVARRHSIGGDGNKSPKRDTIGIVITNIDDVEPDNDYDAIDGDMLPLPPPPPPPPPPVSGEISANAVRQKPPVPMLLPPPPTGSELQSFGPTATTKPRGEKSLPPTAGGNNNYSGSNNRGTVPLRSVSDIHADAIRQAVALRREFVETSDMGNVAATIEHRVQRCRPMQRVLYRAVKDSGSTCAVPIALPLSTNGDGFSVDEPVGLYSTGNVSDGNFLSMAEQARQQYIKRRMTSVGPVGSVPSDASVGHRAGDGNFNHVAAAAAAAAADRGRQRRRVTLAGDEIGQSFGIATKMTSFLDPPSNNIEPVVKATNAPANMGRSCGPAEREWSSSSFLSSNVPDLQTSARYGCRSNDGWFTDHCASESESEIILGTMTATSSSAMSDFDSVADYESLILPPPPSFSMQSFEIDGSRFAISPDSERTSDSVVTVEYNYNAIPTPPPPPAFNDGRRNAAEVGHFRSRPIAKWTVDDVACWLGSLQMAEHRRSFASNAIDGRRLTQLGRSELIALGVTQVGQRMTMERYIKRALMTNQ